MMHKKESELKASQMLGNGCAYAEEGRKVRGCNRERRMNREKRTEEKRKQSNLQKRE